MYFHLYRSRYISLYLSLVIYRYLYVFLLISLYIHICLCAARAFSLSVSVCCSIYPTLYMYISISVCIYLCIYLYMSTYISRNLWLFSLSISCFPFLYHIIHPFTQSSIHQSIHTYISVYVYLSLSLYVSIYIVIYRSFCVCLDLSSSRDLTTYTYIDRFPYLCVSTSCSPAIPTHRNTSLIIGSYRHMGGPIVETHLRVDGGYGSQFWRV